MKKSLTLILLLISLSALAQKQSYVNLAASVVEMADNHIIVLNFQNEKKWHTYWKNPGDAGLPINVEFKSGDTIISPIALEWPTPIKYIEQGNMLAFGYENSYQLFYQLTEPQIGQLKNAELNIHGKWLVCKDICIPGSEKLKINLDNNTLGKTEDFKLTKSKISEAYQALPQKSDPPTDLEIALVKANEKNKLVLHYTYSNIDIQSFDKRSNLLTPFPTTPLDFKHESLYYDAELRTLYGKMYVDWDGEYQDPPMPLPEDGKLNTPLPINFLLQTTGKATNIEVRFSDFALEGDGSFDRVVANFQNLENIKNLARPSKKPNSSFLLYIFFAFIGGLILNLMPCVLPVISLKLFGLIAHRDSPQKTILKHNLSYTLGILMSFWVLALSVLLLKSSGEHIGWGFQLQSPLFVFIMLIILLIMSMNMLGLFEFSTPGGRSLGNIQVHNNYSGAFVSGVLATILSTPCSAPFLGTALTFAFTTSYLNIFFIFTAVALGLAFPFILTGFFPRMIAFLPRPGVWMEKLKNILGFSLLLTFVWLYDVFISLIDFYQAAMYINLFFAALFFAFYFRSKISKHPVLSAIVFLIPVLVAMPIKNLNLLDTPPQDRATTHTNSEGLTWNPWSTAKMSELASKNKWVFIDFTASWCLTCKVNKKLVLNTEDFASIAQKNNIELLVGDWSKRDEAITKFLQSYGVVGVPAYFMQTPQGKIIHLGETISISEIEETLKK